MSSTAEIIISPIGKTTVEVSGVTGGGCVQKTEGIIRALGGDVEKQEAKPEMYMQEQAQQTVGY